MQFIQKTNLSVNIMNALNLLDADSPTNYSQTNYFISLGKIADF